MTGIPPYNPKLEQVFKTEAPSQVLKTYMKDQAHIERAINHQYLRRRGVTALVDSLVKGSIIFFNPFKKSWLVKEIESGLEEFVDTHKRTVLLPFVFHRIVHKCRVYSREYNDSFNNKAHSLFEAYRLSMEVFVKHKEKGEIEEKFATLVRMKAGILSKVAFKRGNQEVELYVRENNLTGKIGEVKNRIKELQPHCLKWSRFVLEFEGLITLYDSTFQSSVVGELMVAGGLTADNQSQKVLIQKTRLVVKYASEVSFGTKFFPQNQDYGSYAKWMLESGPKMHSELALALCHKEIESKKLDQKHQMLQALETAKQIQDAEENVRAIDENMDLTWQKLEEIIKELQPENCNSS